MVDAGRQAPIRRALFVALAALALVVQVLIPLGFMPNGGSLAGGLVICTGHGALVVAPDLGKPVKAPGSGRQAPCAFAAHFGSISPPHLLLIAIGERRAPPRAVGRLFDLAPGRGLSAPPPPSQAPPPVSS